MVNYKEQELGGETRFVGNFSTFVVKGTFMCRTWDNIGLCLLHFSTTVKEEVKVSRVFRDDSLNLLQISLFFTNLRPSVVSLIVRKYKPP